jgi:hypothetical protein
VSCREDVACSLYLELRASGLEVWLTENASGEGVLDYGVVMDGLQLLPLTLAISLLRRVLDNENDLVRLLANTRDPDILAIRGEFDCG